MDSISTTRTKLTELRSNLQIGKIFSSLGKSAGQIIDASSHDFPVSEVELPDENDGIQELLARLKSGMREGSLTEVTDHELLELVSHLGSPNINIRDKGIFYLFNDLVQHQILSKEQMTLVFDELISDEMLLSHIFEEQNDAAYQRSFSVMLLSTLIYIDRAGFQFIDSERRNKLVDQIALYIVLENDTRGYNGSNGWIHAYTHIGNILDEISSDTELIRADKLLLMGILIEKYRRIRTPLIFGEPSRLATYLADQLQEDDLYVQYALIALREWRRAIAGVRVRETEGMWHAMFNRQRLLQAMLLNPNTPKDVVDYLEDTNDFMM
ncbi:DUF2785 domain-containing protein [Pediococcus argentinicus]|nr:DUF2785 domain-containing protein [Pediococcus argentinicus]NKZ22730.1 DUF2785 domain-containing protein [Pediococcus argentinicus]GEP19776.1 hypothetical protein LSA03_11600 [Pediococcus argentinicus]